MTLVRPSVAEDPLRKWPREESCARSRSFLQCFSQPLDPGTTLSRARASYKASSIFLKVCSACSKKPKTIDRLNSRSSSSSSISKICSKVKASILSPRSGRPTEPSSLCVARGQFSALGRPSWNEIMFSPCLLRDGCYCLAY